MTNPKKQKPLVRRAFLVLTDWRLWIIVIAFSGLCVLVDLAWGPRVSGMVSLPLGIVVSFLLGRLDFDPSGRRLSLLDLVGRTNLLYALTGIMVLQGAEALPRFALLPWHWVYGDQIETHLWALGFAVFFDWLSFFVAGYIIGYAIPKRALFATMMGLAVFLPMALTEVLAGERSHRAFLVAAQLLHEPDIGGSEFEIFRSGAVIGLLIRASMTIYVARLVSSRVRS